MRKFRVQPDNDLSEPIETIVFPKIPNDSNWIPACGGTEQPFTTRTGRRLLYCWNTRNNSGRDGHAYLDLDTDMILSYEEAEAAMGNIQ